MSAKLAVVTLAVIAVAARTAAAQWTETESTPPGLDLDDFYGSQVAVVGDTAYVSAPGDDDGNEPVRVLGRDQGGPGNWGELTRLTDGAPGASGGFGRSMSVDGNFVLVGSPGFPSGGSAYLFHRHQGGDDTWGLVKQLTAPFVMTGNQFGLAVAIGGDVLVVGDPIDSTVGGESGAAHVFERHQGGANNWGFVTTLHPFDPGPFGNFGIAATVDGDTLVVGAQSGAYVYERDLGGPGAWGLRLKLPNPPGGGTLGETLALRGDLLVAGNDSNGTLGVSAGAVHLLSRDHGGPDAWGLVDTLYSPSPQVGAAFGNAVTLSEDGLRIVAGSRFYDGAFFSQGAAIVFDRHMGGLDAWGVVGELEASTPQGCALFGGAVAVSGDTLLIGASQDFGGDTGAAFFYDAVDPAQSYCTAGVSASGCQATLVAAGTASATGSSGFFLTALAVEGAKDGLYFFGTNGRQANPWGNGTSFQCAVPPVQRAGLLTGTGTAGACDGSFAQDLNALWCAACPKPQKNPGAGAVVQAQLWYRDPLNTSNQTTSLSSALEFTVQP